MTSRCPGWRCLGRCTVNGLYTPASCSVFIASQVSFFCVVCILRSLLLISPSSAASCTLPGLGLRNDESASSTAVAFPCSFPFLLFAERYSLSPGSFYRKLNESIISAVWTTCPKISYCAFSCFSIEVPHSAHLCGCKLWQVCIMLS